MFGDSASEMFVGAPPFAAVREMLATAPPFVLYRRW
jgi:hypothetical protein